MSYNLQKIKYTILRAQFDTFLTFSPSFSLSLFFHMFKKMHLFFMRTAESTYTSLLPEYFSFFCL